MSLNAPRKMIRSYDSTAELPGAPVPNGSIANVGGLLYKKASDAWSLLAGYIAAGSVTQAQLVAASLDGTVAKVVAEDAVIGGIEVVHQIAIAAGALAEKNITLTHKTRVIDAWVVLTGAGVANTTLKVQNGATTITNALDVSGADKAVVRAATLDDAQWEIAAGGTLRIKTETGATQPACKVFVRGIRIT